MSAPAAPAPQSTAPDTAGKFPRRYAWALTAFFLLAYVPRMVDVRGPFDRTEDSWHDHLFVSQEDSLPKGDPRILLLAMDDDTGKKYGFPLPRSVQARALDALREAGAKVVVFDVLFMEKRPGDEQLAAATKRHGKTIHLYHLETLTKEGEQDGRMEVQYPVDVLMDAAYDLGFPNVDSIIDPDGHLRRGVFYQEKDVNGHETATDPRRFGEQPKSVDTVAFAAYTGKSVQDVVAKWGSKQWLNFRPLQTWRVHPGASETGERRELRTIEAPYRHISMGDLLDGKLPPDVYKLLKGSLVIVGSTALGYFDHYPTPFISQAPGAEYHCNVLDNMLHDDFMRRLPVGWQLLAVCALIWIPVFLLHLAPVGAALTALGVLLLWWGFGYWSFFHGVLVDFIAPTAALLSAFLGQAIHRMLVEGQEKKRIKGLFGQFVAPEVVEDLASNPDKARLGGVRRDMTMLFLDIAHFTSISEKMAPEDLIQFLNKYLSALSQVMLNERAVVGNYIGDCIMAFWNAPVLPTPDHRARACVAAIEAQKIMRELNSKLDMKLPEVPAIRIGINSGQVTVGMTGSEKKLQYTTLGDEVNLSSRLEGANKFFGSNIMVSESTWDGAKDAVEGRELGRVRVVGKETPIRVFELLAKKGELTDDWKKALESYNKGLVHFGKRQYEEAVIAFSEVVKIFPNDGPGTLYLNAARDYAAIPPEENWDGVFNLTAK